jgi:release factor glutamine methyltransferase
MPGMENEPVTALGSPSPEALLRQACEFIDASDARPLLAHALGRPVSWLFAHADEPVDAALARRFESLVQARRAGQPVAYLTGSRGFWSLELQVTPATLIPRPETELLVELALARLLPQTGKHIQRVADLGTGSGAIALAIARERPLAQIVATDASEQALAVAAANAAAHAIGSVQFSHGSWWEPLAGRHFDLVASNPPYIAEGDRHLEEGDLRFEPAAALSSGIDGLDAIRQIVSGAGLHLHAGGWLLLEHGWEQAAAVRALLVQAGFHEVASERDLESRERVTLGRWFP